MMKNSENAGISLILTVAAAFAVTVSCCILFLYITAFIPQSAIHNQCVNSAEYFRENELFPLLTEGQFNTRQDNYADCILQNIIYNIGQDEEESLFSSLIKASYYCEETQNVNEGFWESVTENPDANVDYFRYWHGSMVLLRPLLVFFDIEGVRTALGISAHLLMLAATFVLWKKKHKALAVCSLLAMFFVNSWVTAFCVEYVTMFLVMGASCLWTAVTWKESQDPVVRRRRFLCLMAVCGVTACFLDFLTTETLTVTMPLFWEVALGISENRERRFGKHALIFVLQSGITWGISYALMFLLKWILAAAVLGFDAMKEAVASAAERMRGTVYLGISNLDPEADFAQRLSGALFRNEGMLFPFRNEMNIILCAFLFIFLVLAGMSVIYLFHTEKLNLRNAGVFLLIGCIPYLRFLALSNHAYMHYFFTYRAQFVTVSIVLYLTWEYGLSELFRSKCAFNKKKEKRKRK